VVGVFPVDMQYGRRTEGTTCWGNGRAGRALCSPSRPCALRGDAPGPAVPKQSMVPTQSIGTRTISSSRRSAGGRTRAGGSEAEHGSDAEHRNQDKVRKFEYRSTNIEEVLSLGHLDLLSVTVSNFGFRISNFYPILVPPLCGGTHLR